VLSLGVVPPFYVAIKNLEARWFPESVSDTEIKTAP
jgi:HAE1 family hydrophobic/amphiphilic exporter-1